jgi:hypothetical protein
VARRSFDASQLVLAVVLGVIAAMIIAEAVHNAHAYPGSLHRPPVHDTAS